jgi:1A family penicillin-binding protein
VKYRSTIAIVAGVAAAAITLGFLFWHINADATRAAATFTLDSGPQATILYDAHDRPVFTLFLEQRTDVPLAQMSPHVIAAVLAAEDRRFFDHHGSDIRRTVSAALANLRAGHIVEGGSTITQQLVRMSNGDRARTYSRKLREILIARAIERRFSKDAILATYLNKIYLGEGFYGVEAAARGYFGKSAADVTPLEAATLAAMIQSPTKYARDAYAAHLRARRNWILATLVDQHRLDAAAYREAAAAPVQLPVSAMFAAAKASTAESRNASDAQTGLYFKEAVRQQLRTIVSPRDVLAGGLRVYTTVDMSMQSAAEQAVSDRLRALDKDAEPSDPLQGSLVAIEPQTGFVKALVGGRSFAESPFDRARQAHRQPGSAFKPFVFASALELGYQPGTMLRGLDLPLASASAADYLPRDPHGAAEMTMRDALVVSSNHAAVHLMENIGLSSVLMFAQRMGINSQLPAVPSLALGSGEVTLLELTSAYGVFTNQGVRTEPVLIRRIESAQGEVLFRGDAAPRRVIREDTAYLTTSMLADVVLRGTGSEARREGFTLPAAGKTGTTNGYADAWFIGYTPRLVAGVWIGYDDPHEIRKRGFASVVAVPAWTSFMKAATSGERGEPFTQPADITRVAYCRDSGDHPGIYYDLARIGSVSDVDPSTCTSTTPTGVGKIRIVAAGRTPGQPLLTPAQAIEILRRDLISP